MHQRLARHFGALAGTAIALILAAPGHAEPIAPSHRIIAVPPGQNAPFATPQPTTRARTATPPAANTQHQPNQFRQDNTQAPPLRPSPDSDTPAIPASVEQPAAPTIAPSPAAPNVASPSVAAPDVAASIAAAPAEISAKLRELVTANLGRLVSRNNERDAVAKFYQSTSFTPLWIGNGALTDRTKAVIAHLRSVDADGLEPNDYRLPTFAGSAEALADAELKFTITVLTYARHALSGRVHFSRVSPSIDYKDNYDPADVLRQVASSSDLGRTLQSFNPQQPGYLALKAKLAELRGQARQTGPAPIPNGQTLKYGRDRQGRELVMRDHRVPALRERLGLPPQADTNYDRALAAGVAKFQKAHGLKDDGALASGTVSALNGPSHEQRLGAILATMERWRWMSRDLGRTHVMLNIPDYHLRVMNNGAPVWVTRVVVGKPSQATPLLTETMKFITVNPIWNVPQSIIYNELLPLFETSDPQVFDKMGLKVERRNNGEIRVYQPSGDRNALGRIRFNFPNKFLVYQHDTPEKHYFAHDRRAYSHGCMRVQDPLKYAEVMLSFGAPRGRHTVDSLRRMFADEEKQIDFQFHIPVHITYQTAFVDDDGKLQFREDIYGLDSKIESLLKGSERALADVVMERPLDPNFKPSPVDLQRIQNAARSPNPLALFEQLFR